MLQVTHLAPGKGQMLHLCNPCNKGPNGLMSSCRCAEVCRGVLCRGAEVQKSCSGVDVQMCRAGDAGVHVHCACQCADVQEA